MITSYTKLACIIGNPVSHSLSPVMYNAAFAHVGLDMVFLAFSVENAKEAIDGLQNIGVSAIVATVPHKLIAFTRADKTDLHTKKIGAANILINQNGMLVGSNTDWIGALDAIHEKIPNVKNKKVTILGAGGAARAIIYGFKKEGALITLANRSVSKGKALAKEFGINECYPLDNTHIIENADIIINTTSVGMGSTCETSPINTEYLHANQIIFDIVYTPHETKLLKIAKEKKATCVYGYKMILYGGVKIFELMTQITAPVDIMEKALVAHLS